MAHNIERSLSSLTAIAAATLLLSTPALAQSQPATNAAPQPPAAAAPAATPDAPSPAMSAPADQPPAATTDTAPAAATPTPATPAPTMTTNPVVQSVPDSSQPAAQTKTPNTQTPTAPAQTARAITQPRAVVHTAARPVPAPQAAGGIPAATPAQKPAPSDAPSPGLTRRDPAGLYTADGTAVAATTTTRTSTPQSPYARYWPLEAAGGIIVLGLIGYAFTRRREEEDEDMVYAVPVTDQPLAERPTVPATAAVAPTLAVKETPAASVMPAGPVPTGSERDALLQRMVDAPPDAANPFHTAKARLRRARMILASRKQALRDQATEAFDWRTYKPSLKPATLGGETKPAVKARSETTR